MDDNIQSTNLVIQSVEDKGTQIKFKGSDNKTYSFFKNKRDGGMTVAYQSFQKFKVGETICVNYKDDESDKYPGTVFHTVISVKAADGVPARKETPQYVAVPSSPAGRNYEQEAYVKCCSIWPAKEATSFNAINLINEGAYWKLFQAIKADGEKRFAGGLNGTQTSAGEPINDLMHAYDDIPFGDDEAQ